MSAADRQVLDLPDETRAAGARALEQAGGAREARGRKERDSYAGGWPGVLALFTRRASSETGVS